MRNVPAALGLRDCRVRGRRNCAGHAMLFQCSLAFILCSEFQTDEPPCGNDSDLLDGHSHNHASVIVRDYVLGEIVRNESYSDIRSWRLTHGSNRILDFVGSGYVSEN